jgi:hypothetical protein
LIAAKLAATVVDQSIAMTHQASLRVCQYAYGINMREFQRVPGVSIEVWERSTLD